MTKHYPRSSPRHQAEQLKQSQEQPREKGWYCKEHDIKYLCDICGHENNKHKQKGDVKYYFGSS